MRTYNGIERPDFTPEFITQLKADEVFVFGSNLAGMHGGGAAYIAFKQFGAVMACGVGLRGQSYAIPASTIQKHRLRYSALLKTVSEETGIRNGIDFIRPKYDRKDSRQQKEANTIRNLEFDRLQIHGNWIILIDDVTTRGTSFVQCVNKLYACGAKYVCGFFMGKTVDI